MKISAHCFAFGARTDRHQIDFKFKEYAASLKCLPRKKKGENGEDVTDYELLLEISKSIDPSELKYPSEEERKADKDGKYIQDMMRPYNLAMVEASQFVEGMLTLQYNSAPPKFDPYRIIVNASAESPEEETAIKSGEVSGGFGSIFTPPQKPFYQYRDGLFDCDEEGTKHLPALSFLAQGSRSMDEKEHEVAFFLFFRVLEGYFSDGAKEVESAMLASSDELKKCLKYAPDTMAATQGILTTLGLKSKSSTSFEGFISDLVLIRHKLTHFSVTNQERHHRAAIKYDLEVLNHFLRISCILLLRTKIGIDK